MDRSKFYDVVRSKMGSINQSQVDGFEFLLTTGETRQSPLCQLAYILATTFHETASTMQPIAEYGKGNGHEYGKPLPQYNNQRAYGRGYVQLTWDYNYEKADAALRLNGALLKNFELALDPKIAAPILFQGMGQGWFTSKALGQYVTPDNVTKIDYYNARRVVNGTDKADLIKGYAITFQSALEAAKYVAVPTQVPLPPDVPLPEGPPKPRGILQAIIDLIMAIFGRKK
jgi:hypothetical protein